MPNIGKLNEVDVRELWRHEQYNFSNWLSEKNNIEYLNDILGLTLVDINKEEYVDPFRCDLVAKDETSNIKVIIENQLEGTNHDHLGKIITYASGLGANVIVWIVTEAKEEHRAAIEWLNNNTNEDISFFLIEIHAYKIGDSDPAPKFEVIEKPNDFVKHGKSKQENTELNKSESERLHFWQKFNEKLKIQGNPFPQRKATTAHWYDVAIGTTKAHISINLVNKDNNIVMELYINDDKSFFDQLFKNKEEIEVKLGFNLEWERLDNKKASRIKYIINGLNFEDQSNYDELMNKIISCTIKMKDVFKSYLP